MSACFARAALAALIGFLFVAPAAPLAAGEAGRGVIEGFVFLDADHDGTLDPDETGLRIVPVRLKGPVNRTVLSAMNGAYRFDALPAGSYDVTVEPGPEYRVDGRPLYAGLSVEGDTLTEVNFALAEGPGSGTGSASDEDAAAPAAPAVPDAAAASLAEALAGLAAAGSGAGAQGDPEQAALTAAAMQVLSVIAENPQDPVSLAALQAALTEAEAADAESPVTEALALALAMVSEPASAGPDAAAEPPPTLAGAAAGAPEAGADAAPELSAGGMPSGAEASSGMAPAAAGEPAAAAGEGMTEGAAMAAALPGPADAPAQPAAWPERGAAAPAGMPQTGALPAGRTLAASLVVVLSLLGVLGIVLERRRGRAD